MKEIFAKIIMYQIGVVLKLFKTSFDEIKFVAMVTDDGEYYKINFGYNKNIVSFRRIEKLIKKIRKLISVIPIPDFADEFNFDEIEIPDFEEFISPSSSSFNNLATSTLALKAGLTIRRQGDGFKKGSLGALIKLKELNDFFILSNYHVLASKSVELGHPILDSKSDKKIGELYWFKKDNRHDIAIAKVTCSTLCDKVSDTINYDFGELGRLTKFEEPVAMTGGISDFSEGITFSNYAHVNVKSKWFINQLLLKNLSSQPGDSGTILVKSSSSKGLPKDVVGLVFAKDGSDSNLTVANKIDKLLSKKIIPSKSKQHSMPEIQFDFFY